MADKRHSSSDDASQVFRQFAWHLAGSLAAAKASPPRKSGTSRSQPAKAVGRR
jgi:hypothetical protein